MNERELVRKIEAVFEGLGIAYFITGGMASIAYGEPRFTNDIDVVADIPASRIPAFLSHFPDPDYYLSEQAVRTAVRDRFQFNVLHPASGLKIDVMVPSRGEYDGLRFGRRKRLDIDADTRAWFASPEDVIVKKLLYFREGGSDKHLRDIAGMMQVSGEEIDSAYIAEWAGRLGVTAEWEMIGERIRLERVSGEGPNP